MGAGRRPTPPNLQVLRGNPGKRKVNDQQPATTRGVPPQPAWLSERAASAWDRIAPLLDAMGVLTLQDEAALTLLCDAYAEWLEARDIYLAEGRTYRSVEKRKVMIRAHPAVGLASDAWRRIRLMLVEFGLTPSARARVKGEGGRERDPFADFLDGRRSG